MFRTEFRRDKKNKTNFTKSDKGVEILGSHDRSGTKRTRQAEEEEEELYMRIQMSQFFNIRRSTI